MATFAQVTPECRQATAVPVSAKLILPSCNCIDDVNGVQDVEVLFNPLSCSILSRGISATCSCVLLLFYKSSFVLL